MTNVLTMTTPLLRQTVGFDQFNDLFESLLNDVPENSDGKHPDKFDKYPPYNIEKYGDDSYRIVMAVAGFSMDDLEIILEDGVLNVSGSIKGQEKQSDVQFLHKGIGTRAFRQNFRLADYIEVKGAEMKDGMLGIELARIVPEEKKPRMIPIAGEAKALAGKGTRRDKILKNK